MPEQQRELVTLVLDVDTLVSTVDALSRDIARHAPGTVDLDNRVVTYGRAALEHRPFATLACGCQLREIVWAGGGLNGHENCEITRLARLAQAQRFADLPDRQIGELDAEMRMAYDRAVAQSDPASTVLPPFLTAGIDANAVTVAWAGPQCRQCAAWADLVPAARDSGEAERLWIDAHNAQYNHYHYYRWSIIRSTATPDPRI